MDCLENFYQSRYHFIPWPCVHIIFYCARWMHPFEYILLSPEGVAAPSSGPRLFALAGLTHVPFRAQTIATIANAGCCSLKIVSMTRVQRGVRVERGECFAPSLVVHEPNA